MLTCYSPVRHSTLRRSAFLVRLACVKHAASVHPEPGSNSPFEAPPQGRVTTAKKVPDGVARASRRRPSGCAPASRCRDVFERIQKRSVGGFAGASPAGAPSCDRSKNSLACITCSNSIRFSRFWRRPLRARPPAAPRLPSAAARGSILPASPGAVKREPELFPKKFQSAFPDVT